MSNQLEIYVGDAQAFNLTIRQNTALLADGITPDDANPVWVPVDIDGWTFLFAASTSLDRITTPVTWSVTNQHFDITDHAAGEAKLTIPPDATTALALSRDTVYFFSVVGTESGTLPHTIATGTIAVLLAADDLLP